jgi:hypothetical protein
MGGVWSGYLGWLEHGLGKIGDDFDVSVGVSG